MYGQPASEILLSKLFETMDGKGGQHRSAEIKALTDKQLGREVQRRLRTAIIAVHTLRGFEEDGTVFTKIVTYEKTVEAAISAFDEVLGEEAFRALR